MSQLPTRIRTKKDLASLIAHATTLDDALSAAHAYAGAPFFRKRPQGFQSLLKIMVEQQLSRASADAIWGRLEQAVPGLDPYHILAAPDDKLRAVGLSRPKVRYAKTIANAVTSGTLDLTALPRLPDEQVMQNLCSITGIGRWSAEIYMLFCLGRPNVWPAGDVAVQAALQMVMDLDLRPDPKRMDEIAARWHPVRGIAALILWQYYRVIKNRPVWV